MIALHVLASGSKGNAAVVEDAATGEGLLVDCGVTAKALIERCEQAGFDPLRLRAVLVTHDHSDHVKGLGGALRCLRRRARKLGVAWQARQQRKPRCARWPWASVLASVRWP